MADEPISALPLFTSYSTADEVEILDVSDTTFASTGTNKRIQFSTLLSMAGVGGSGVTSVAMTAPSWLTVQGSPITTSGTLAVTATAGQIANEFLATPNGSSGAVSLRAIASADLPTSPTITGNLTLSPTTSSSSGVVMKGSNPFMSDFTPAGGVGNNTFLGTNAGNFTMGPVNHSYEGCTNTAIGNSAFMANTIGYNNTAVGQLALAANTTGLSITAIGQRALTHNTTGHDNVSVGQDSMNAGTTGYYNTAVGTDCMYYNSTGAYNTGVGAGANWNNAAGNYNTAVGFYAMQGVLGTTHCNYNTAVGFEAINAITTGGNNTAVGYEAAFNVTSGNLNVAVGDSALYNQTTGGYNVGIGYKAVYGATGSTATNCVGIGYSTLAAMNTGGECTAVGHLAGIIAANAWNSLFLGSHAGQYETATNTILIDTLDRTNRAGGRTGASDLRHHECDASKPADHLQRWDSDGHRNDCHQRPENRHQFDPLRHSRTIHRDMGDWRHLLQLSSRLGLAARLGMQFRWHSGDMEADGEPTVIEGGGLRFGPDAAAVRLGDSFDLLRGKPWRLRSICLTNSRPC